jgi:hypothetical protein
MFESLASCFAFRCSASLNMTAIDEALQRTLFASDVRLGKGRGDFYLSYFAVRLAAGLEFHFLPGIRARAEKQDPRDLAVNIHLVKALIEIVLLRLLPLASFPLFSPE